MKRPSRAASLRRLCLSAAVAVGGAAAAAWAALPVGSAPAPVAFEHFPDRLHTFIWRNWNVVGVDRLAAVLRASPAEAAALAAGMGLPPARPAPAEQLRRGYITILRRNWHLLPYPQLLQMVGMTEEQLERALWEDDFLWIKFGMLKPRCKPLYYRPPDETARRREREIAAVVRRHFGDRLRSPGEPRFQFIERMGRPAAAPASSPRPAASGSDAFEARFLYSYFGLYGDPLFEADPALDPYPEGLLERLSALGVNGVWLPVLLRNLAPGGTLLPGYGKESARRLRNLRRLVRRAARHGLGVYLYLNEPRAMPVGFFIGRERLRGVREGPLAALCTSRPEVRAWLRQSLEHVFRETPGLAGVFAITASENLTSCASHGRQAQCPRCSRRPYADIIAEVIRTIEEGVHAGNPQAKVIAWDWGWHGHGDASDVIAALPTNVWLMSVSEWGLPIVRGGVSTQVGEYSLSAVGPGPRALRHWRLARSRGLKTMAKVQFNNSWELSSLPYLPVMHLVAQHARRLAETGVNGLMLSWTLGGYPSPNLALASRFQRSPPPSTEAVLNAAARERYGPAGAAAARRAWSAFSQAFQEYPFHAGVVYHCPVQYGPANLLYPRPTGYRATMTGIPYDDLDAWRGPYPAETFARQFAVMARRWAEGIPALKAAVSHAPPSRRAEASEELRYAQAAEICFRSVANQAWFILHRNALAERGLPEDSRRRRRRAVRSLLQDEISLAKRLYDLAKADSRVGFEAANQYFYLPNDLLKK
ncbi:MAG: hypothetical protein J7M29_04465 [Verrucomicrobia bacterium]|nr:hypothetical protein [Verrucomicrobiota bacterium]